MLNKIAPLLLLLLAYGCTDDEDTEPSTYSCETSFNDSSTRHPNASRYQAILDNNQKLGMVGSVLLVKDAHGLWQGSSGYADLEADVAMQTCTPFLIASISKVFTSAAVYRYIDKGLLRFDDNIAQYLDDEVVEQVANVKDCQISHLLAHTSGIPDYYTTGLDLDRINKEDNDWRKEDVLKYSYGKPATNKPGETYYYCNNNFLLLSMILEKVSGKSFERVYQEEIFIPNALGSAYYSEIAPIPAGTAKGYVELHGNKKWTETEFLYGDELGIGGDGGIAINAYDLAQFLERLGKGEVMSDASYKQMTDFFDMPEGWHWDTYGQTKNGYGTEYFGTKYGYAIGHTGGVDGFTTYGFYFPEEDKTYILLNNSINDSDRSAEIFKSVLDIMFEE